MTLGERIAAAVANEVRDQHDGDLHPVITQTIARVVDAECWPKPDPSTNTSHAMRAALRVIDLLHPFRVDDVTELKIATAIDHEYKHARSEEGPGLACRESLIGQCIRDEFEALLDMIETMLALESVVPQHDDITADAIALLRKHGRA